MVVLAVYGSAWLRFDLRLGETLSPPVHRLAFTLWVTFFVVISLTSMFVRGHERGSFAETAQLLRGGAVLFLVSVISVFATPFMPVPRSLPFVVPALALLGMFALRFVVRSYRWGRPEIGPDDTPVVVFGAGSGGQQLLAALSGDRTDGPRLIPVALLDDDPLKGRWRIQGLRVSGPLERLPDVVAKTNATAVVVAIPSIEQEGCVGFSLKPSHSASTSMFSLPRASSSARPDQVTCAD